MPTALDAAVQRQVDLLLKAGPVAAATAKALVRRVAAGGDRRSRRCRQRRTDRRAAGFARRPGRPRRIPRQAQARLVRLNARSQHMTHPKHPSPIVNIADVELQPRPPPSAASGDAAQRYDARMGVIAPRVGAQLLGYNITAVPPGKRAFPKHNQWSTRRCSSSSRAAANCTSATRSIRCAPATSSPARPAARKPRTSWSIPAPPN